MIRFSHTDAAFHSLISEIIQLIQPLMLEERRSNVLSLPTSCSFECFIISTISPVEGITPFSRYCCNVKLNALCDKIIPQYAN